MPSRSIQLPKRSPRFGIGKEIGGAVYVHRSYEELLGDVLKRAKANLPGDIEYTVVKFNYQTLAISFVQCDDFDSASEPTVGDIVTVGAEGTIRRRSQPSDPEIYHHKWLFVADDYTGFDVQQSAHRSAAWLQLDDVDRQRIGRKSYWEEQVVPRIEDRQQAMRRKHK